MASDDVERRAAELRAQREAEEQQEQRDHIAVEDARKELARRFIAALGTHTSYPVKCVKTAHSEDEWPHGVTISFWVFVDGRSLEAAVCRLGVERLEGTEAERRFTYYFEPAVRLSLADGVTPVELKDISQGEAISHAVKLTVEWMAQWVSDGGRIGTSAEVAAWQQAEVNRHAAAKSEIKRKNARSNRRGCLAVFVGFVILCLFIGLLGNLAECKALAC